MTGFPRHRMKIREERVFIEGSNVDRTFLETLKQVKRDDFVSLRTAIEDHQSNYFFLLCYIFFSSWDMENTLPCSDRQKWKPPSKSTRGPSWSRNIKFLWWWMEYCVRSGHTWNSPPKLDLQQLWGTQIWWLQTLEFPVELWDQDVQNSTSQHNDDVRGKTHFPEIIKNIRSCERETKIEERDQLHL